MEAMTARVRNRAWMAGTVCTWVLALVATVASAQLGVPELRQLGALGPAQRDQVLSSMGISDSDLAALLSQQGQTSIPAESEALSEENPLLQLPIPIDETLLEEPTLEANSTIVLTLRLSELDDTDQSLLEELPQFLADLVGQRTYELDRYGRLHLQNVFHIPLAGLTEEQATQRIAAEPGLDVFAVSVTLLPLSDTGSDALELFGSDFFARADSLLFNPAAVAVPGNYVIGPGDVLEVNLFGADGERMELTVDRDGRVALPQIGPVAVAGLSLDEVRNELRTRIGTQMIGVTTSVTIQRLRAIQVFVLGDVKQPGAYTVDSLTTVTNALLLSGGVRENGTLRRVQLKRDGSTVATLDLYDLLLRGDTRNDRRLRNGDVVFVPSIGQVVGVEGEVNRPARYELRQSSTVGDLLTLAGGLTADAQADAARLERILPRGGRTVVDVDLASAAGRAQALRNGDVLRVVPTSRRAEGIVTLAGHVRRPGDFQWRPNLRLTDVISSPAQLRDFADSSYLLIRREDGLGQLSVLAADLRKALVAPGGADDVVLEPRDVITVFELGVDRSGIIEPLLENLTDQATLDAPSPIVRVIGEVHVPGRYPLAPGMTVSDLVRSAGGLTENSFLGQAELTRQVIEPGRRVSTQVIQIDLAAALAGDAGADIAILPRDYLLVKTLPESTLSHTVTLMGEVRFPGVYPVSRGETLATLIERAGGLTEFAFPGGATFTREELREREQTRLDQLARRLESDLAAAAVQSARSDSSFGSAEAVRLGQELLAQIRETPAVGRLVIDLQRLVAEGTNSPADVALRDGDLLIVPEFSQEVTVIGEVQFPGSHLHVEAKSLEEYLGNAGGITSQADQKRIYVVRANGAVVTSSDSKWFRSSRIPISYGDTIVVPLDSDRMRPLALWSSISGIIYQLGLSAATARAVGVF